MHLPQTSKKLRELRRAIDRGRAKRRKAEIEARVQRASKEGYDRGFAQGQEMLARAVNKPEIKELTKAMAAEVGGLISRSWMATAMVHVDTRNAMVQTIDATYGEGVRPELFRHLYAPVDAWLREADSEKTRVTYRMLPGDGSVRIELHFPQISFTHETSGPGRNDQRRLSHNHKGYIA